MKFNKQVVQLLRQEIINVNALTNIGEEHGIHLTLGNIRFDSTEFTTKLTVVAGDGSEAAKANFERNSFKYNIPEDWYGKEFNYNGIKYRIMGINTRSSRMPIQYEDMKSGAKYKASAAWVKELAK